MNQHKNSFRIGALSFLVVVMLGVFAVRLFQIQVQQAQEYGNTDSGTYTYYTRVTAARGEILDRDGNVLVGNRAAFNVVVLYDVLFSSEDPNESLRQLTNLCTQNGLEVIDHLPVTRSKPYTYTKEEYTTTWNGYFRQYLSERDWDPDISAPQLISRLKDRYNIPQDWSEEEARRVISVRYELELRHFTTLPTYELVNDVDSGTLAAITELNVPGINVVASTVREYHTTYAAHILGYIGDMNPEEYEYYQQYDYAMDAQVGKSGLERAFELELHGTDGLRETTVAEDGTILEERYVVEPKAGNNVELTIDLDLQMLCEDALEKDIMELRENGVGSSGSGKDAEGGAIVVMGVDSGEILVSASYPTYNLATFFEDYNDLLEQDYAPMFNRVLQAEYPPGSVFKMVTTIAGIQNGVVDPGFKVEDLGIYRRFELDEGFTPRCMLYTNTYGTHGVLDITGALEVSCNYYFYELGWLTGIDLISETAKSLGLGEPTGVELVEEIGYRACPEVKERIYDDPYWYGGDTISAAIGQSENRFTPLQLCSYTCALANRGTRYNATFLRRVLSPDYEELVKENEPTIASQIEISDETYYAYTEGMRKAARTGTASAAFFDYDMTVCAKTGTAEHGSGGSDHASFVLFAPADDPQIAISIYVEKGAQGGRLGHIARLILDAYFSEAGALDMVPNENVTE